VASVYTKFRGRYIGETLIAESPEGLELSANSLQHISFREDGPNDKCVMSGNDNPNSTAAIAGAVGSVAQPSTAGQPSRVRVSQGVSQGLLIKKVAPHYPDDARQARIQGTVVLNAVIGKNGDVEELTLVSGHPMLAPAAIAAVKQWKYKPYLLQGEPVKVETQIVVNFSLLW
jgi:protein TonB